jgi:hypothetical protein
LLQKPAAAASDFLGMVASEIMRLLSPPGQWNEPSYLARLPFAFSEKHHLNALKTTRPTPTSVKDRPCFGLRHSWKLHVVEPSGEESKTSVFS